MKHKLAATAISAVLVFLMLPAVALAGPAVDSTVSDVFFEADDPDSVISPMGALDSAINPTTADFDRAYPEDISVTITPNGNTLLSINNGPDALTPGSDYTIADNTVTIDSGYLMLYDAGTTVTLKFHFSAGADQTLTINILPPLALRTLTDPDSGVSVTGMIWDVAGLEVTPLDQNSDEYKALAAALNDGQEIILAYYIDLSSKGGLYDGALTIAFPAGTQYNGQTLTILHNIDGTIERHTGVVEDGILTVSSEILGDFAVAKSDPVTGLPAAHKMYKGGRVTWNPQPSGGLWDWDEDFFSAAFNSPATFTALKAGTSTITYTVNGISQSVTVTIMESELPQTGQNDNTLHILILLALLCGGAAFALPIFLKKKEAH